MSERVRALNKVDLPTLGKPTIPSVRLTRTILTHTNAGVAEWAGCSLNHSFLVQYRSVSSKDSLTPDPRDRKSTRLNSSHVAISYAVFCLKIKKNRN